MVKPKVRTTLNRGIEYPSHWQFHISQLVWMLGVFDVRIILYMFSDFTKLLLLMMTTQQIVVN